jgi:hypothetical protein
MIGEPREIKADHDRTRDLFRQPYFARGVTMVRPAPA